MLALLDVLLEGRKGEGRKIVLRVGLIRIEDAVFPNLIVFFQEVDEVEFCDTFDLLVRQVRQSRLCLSRQGSPVLFEEAVDLHRLDPHLPLGFLEVRRPQRELLFGLRVGVLDVLRDDARKN